MFIRDTRMEWHIFGAYFGDEKIQVGRDLNSNLNRRTHTYEHTLTNTKDEHTKDEHTKDEHTKDEHTKDTKDEHTLTKKQQQQQKK